MSTIITNNNIAESMFTEMIDDLPERSSLPELIIVQHIVENTIPFINALKKKFDISCVIPKQRSEKTPSNGGTFSYLEYNKIPIISADRDELGRIQDGNHGLPFATSNRPFVILDVGGYFAGCANILSRHHDGRLMGIVEDTENGHQKYERLYKDNGTTNYPIFSVARSPLKEPEDFLVGQSIAFSVEYVVREHYSLMLNRQVLVIGYGKIGRSIANTLAVRNVNVWVYDDDPIKQAQAMSHGFRVPERSFAIANAGVIFGATGNKSLNGDDFKNFKNYAFIASVTSAEDEFDLEQVKSSYRITHSDERRLLFQWQNIQSGKVIYLINNGNAANFMNSNALGVYIYLVGSEIISCLRQVISFHGRGENTGIHELDAERRKVLAANWKTKFFETVLG